MFVSYPPLYLWNISSSPFEIAAATLLARLIMLSLLKSNTSLALTDVEIVLARDTDVDPTLLMVAETGIPPT